MRPHRLTHRSIEGVCALCAIVGILLALAAAASAMPTDNGRTAPTAPLTIIRETVVSPLGHGLDAIAWVLISVAAGAAIVGAGYLGARIAIRRANIQAN